MKSILIVDDEKVQIETLKRGLKIKGFKTFESLSGENALLILKENKEINLIITDYSMPGMNGIELLGKIRQFDSKLPVIIMTAYGDKDIAVAAMKKNCNGFLDKPFSLENLLGEINRLI